LAGSFSRRLDSRLTAARCDGRRCSQSQTVRSASSSWLRSLTVSARPSLRSTSRPQSSSSRRQHAVRALSVRLRRTARRFVIHRLDRKKTASRNCTFSFHRIEATVPLWTASPSAWQPATGSCTTHFIWTVNLLHVFCTETLTGIKFFFIIVEHVWCHTYWAHSMGP